MLGDWSPKVTNESLILQNKLVHCFIEGFLFGKEHLINENGRNPVPAAFKSSIIISVVIEMIELILERVARLDQHVPSIDD